MKLKHVIDGTLTVLAGYFLSSLPVLAAPQYVVYQKKTLAQPSALGLKKIANLTSDGRLFLAERSGAALQTLSSSEDFLIERNIRFQQIRPAAEPTDQPNVDEKFSFQWNLRNIGQNDGSGRLGVAGADIDYDALQKAAPPVVKDLKVAIIDSGIDATHPDFAGVSMGGKSFVKGENEAAALKDEAGHGTHVAGIVGAKSGNTIGIHGIVDGVNLQSFKVFDKSGSSSLAQVVGGIQEAISSGSKIVNLSLGSSEESQILLEVMRDAATQGVIFVTAAGNDGSNLEKTPMYPAAYELPNQIVVSSTTNQDKASYYSNFSEKLVDIAAPGERILSTVPNHGYQAMSGTSMAAPHVTAAVALLRQRNPSLTPDQLRTRIVESGTVLDTLRGKTKRATRLSLTRLLGL